MNKYLKYYHTLKYLKAQQIWFRIFYFIRNKIRKIYKFNYIYHKKSSSVQLKLQKSIYGYNSFEKSKDGYKFTFLNISHTFKDKIDWNYSKYGKLWAYNINYFEFLSQKDLDKNLAIELIYKFIDDIENNVEGLEPFPISLRGIHWIRFLTLHDIKDKKIDDSLYAQYYILADNLEYHLLGNHLLENGFSLLFGAYYFYDLHLYRLAKNIIISQMDEQILDDGAHFELSPMYHQHILYRTLDCLNLVKNNDLFQKELEGFLYQKAVAMLSYLCKISYKNGNIPYFSDSAYFIAPATKELKEYANSLEITPKNNWKLSSSGYRKFESESYELIVDVGNIGADYIPGHAHSDTFNYELYIHNKPFIVDTGVSTYQDNERRLLERSTKSHNTVMVENFEQSQVWSSFRVAKRAKIISLQETPLGVNAQHNGYKELGIIHERDFSTNNLSIVISDKLYMDKREYLCYSYIHFHPSITSIEIENNSIITSVAIIKFENFQTINLQEYYFAYGYNNLQLAKVAIISFKKQLKSIIEIKN